MPREESPKLPEGTYELKIDDGPIDWAAALAEFAEADAAPRRAPAPAPAAAAKPAPPPPPAVAVATPAPATETPVPAEGAPGAARPMTRYEELCKKPSMKIERADAAVFNEFSALVAHVSKALHHLEAAVAKDPEVLPERHVKTCVDNLKDTQTLMMKEFHALRNGRIQKKYDPRCVCVQCTTVYMIPLGPDGICDSCRGSNAPKNAPY